MHKTVALITALLSALLLTACVTYVEPRYTSWQAYQQAYPNARFVVTTTRPAPHRTCWKTRRGWRCVR